MSQYKSLCALFALCLLAGSALAAPTDPEPASTAAPPAATDVSTTSPPEPATTEAAAAAAAASTAEPASEASSAATTEAPAVATSGSPSTTTVSAPSEVSSTASMAVSSAQDMSSVANTTFTCYDRKVGYYADVESECKVYHFCILGDYNGQQVYQRVSYLCLNETRFDQQGLDCVEDTKMTAPCAESEKFYEDSNAVLRKAVVSGPDVDKQ